LIPFGPGRHPFRPCHVAAPGGDLRDLDPAGCIAVILPRRMDRCCVSLRADVGGACAGDGSARRGAGDAPRSNRPLVERAPVRSPVLRIRYR